MSKFFFRGVGYLLLVSQATYAQFVCSADGTLTQYTGPGGAVTIPNYVTSIGYEAFYYTGSAITSVIVGSSVTSVGEYAFFTCGALTNVVIGNSVTNVGDYAFYGCGSLSSVTIGDSVNYISGSAFDTCPNLKVVNVTSNNPAYVTVAGVLLTRDQRSLVCFPVGNGATAYTIPNSVTIIEDSAFCLASSLTNISFPNSLAAIGQDAFIQCSSLRGITLPSSVASIGDWAFGYCQSLTNVTVPGRLTSIGASAFTGCTRLTRVNIPNGVASIGMEAFYNCSSLTTVTIGDSATSIGEGAFAHPVPNGSVGSYGGLTGVYFGGNAPTADQSVFFGNPANLTVYYLPGTTGWADFSQNTGIGTALWTLPYPLVLSSGLGPALRSNQMGFAVSWATNKTVVVQASTNLANPAWQPLQTNILADTADLGWFYFADPQWTNSNARYYRVVSQ
jgi:hypothetical protein